MTQSSPNLALPYIQPSQAQKHVTHNEAVERLDALAQLVLEAIAAETPPASAPDGAAWGLGAAPAGDWAGQGGAVALRAGGGWLFLAPQPGWRAWDKGAGLLRVWTGSAWEDAAAGTLQNVSGVGVGTTSDAVNRLAVAGDATLLTHAGGDHRLKVNKAGTGDTASLLFQSGFAGRAEMGLTGSDDFALRVSPDGTSFRDALVADAGSGAVRVPALGSVTIEVADDGAASVAVPAAHGIVAINVIAPAPARTGHAGLVSFAAGNAPAMTALAAGPDLSVLGDVAPTGTTGPSGGTGIAVRPGTIHVENRSGAARTYALTFIGAL